jgi:hypothetical protein
MSAVTDGASLSELAAQRLSGEPAAKLAVKSSSTVIACAGAAKPIAATAATESIDIRMFMAKSPTPIVSAFVTLCRSSIANKRAFRCAKPEERNEMAALPSGRAAKFCIGIRLIANLYWQASQNPCR